MRLTMTAFLVGCLGLSALTGCAWVGETAGQVHAQMERNTAAIREGYNKGYEEETAKPVQPEEEEAPFKLPPPERFTHATSKD